MSADAAHAGSFSDLKDCLSVNTNAAIIPHEVQKRTHHLCSDFLGGSWKAITEEEIDIVRMQGGISNVLFLCKLPSGVTPIGSEPDKVLLRVYFNPETESNLVAESVIFTLLSERKLGPKLYAIFNGGRLEEYIVSRPLTCSEIQNTATSREIARNLAQIHDLVVPISKEPVYIFEALDRWTQQIKRPDFSIDNGSKGQKMDLQSSFLKEIHVIKTCLKYTKSPVHFCHNDLQEGNILLPSDKNDNYQRLVFIDFEYSSYNHRAFDLANHFCEWAIDYTQTDWPHYKITDEQYPSKTDQVAFIKEYLNARGVEYTDELAEGIMDETRAFVPITHFFWAVWSFLQCEISPVQFGFAEYGLSRLQRYYKTKPQLLELLKRGGKEGAEDEKNCNGMFTVGGS